MNLGTKIHQPRILSNIQTRLLPAVNLLIPLGAVVVDPLVVDRLHWVLIWVEVDRVDRDMLRGDKMVPYLLRKIYMGMKTNMVEEMVLVVVVVAEGIMEEVGEVQDLVVGAEEVVRRSCQEAEAVEAALQEPAAAEGVAEVARYQVRVLVVEEAEVEVEETS